MHKDYIIMRKRVRNTDHQRSSEDNSNGLKFHYPETTIPSLNEYSLGTYYVPRTVLGPGGMAPNGWDMVPVLMGFRPAGQEC